MRSSRAALATPTAFTIAAWVYVDRRQVVRRAVGLSASGRCAMEAYGFPAISASRSISYGVQMPAVDSPRLWMVVIVTNASYADADHADAQLSMAISARKGRDAAKVTVAVSGSGMSRTSTDLYLVGSTWRGTIGPLPIGAVCTFIGSAFDANDVVLFQGMATMGTTENTTVAMLILLETKHPMPDRQCGAGDHCTVCQHYI